MLFHLDDKGAQSLAFDPKRDDKVNTKKVYKNVMQASINDDFVFTEEAQYVEYHDLIKGESNKAKMKDVDEHCRFARPRESETYDGQRTINDVKLTVNCKDSLHIQTATGDLSMKTTDVPMATHGNLLRSFIAADTDASMFLFDDLSLHSYQRSIRNWQREEALSQITQVEIVDPSLVVNADSKNEANIRSMKAMQENIGIAQVPARIIQRRLDNLQVIVKSIQSFFSGSAANDSLDEARIAQPAGDDYGFDKTLVFMTRPNKAVAVSSLKGKTLWSRLIREPVRRMVVD